MNMISTGAFQTEMDASNKQTLAEKFAAVWEKKNAKAARAGGVSLMALSLAACGSSNDTTTTSTDTTTTDTTTTTTTVDAAVTAALQISSTTGKYDDVKGGSGDDTFIAGAGALETGDSVNGGAGADTLSASYTADITVIGTVVDVETINIRSYGADVDTVFDMDTVSGVTTVYADRVDSAASGSNDASVTYSNMTLGTTVGIKSGTATAADRGDVTFTFKATTGTSDSVSLDLQAASVNNVTIAGVETVSVTTSVGANTLADLVIDTASALNISGSQNLTITNEIDFADTAVTTAGAIDATVDASGLTGALSFNPGTGDNVDVTGGSGNDTFAMTTGLDKYDVLKGGDGSDTVSVTAIADDAALDLSTYGFTSIETFQVTGATGLANDPTDISIAADAVTGLTQLTLVESQAHADGNAGDAGTYTVTGLTSGNTVRIVNDKNDTGAGDFSNVGAVTLSLLDGSATTDSLTVELAGTTAQTAAENTVADLAVTEVETLNLVSTHDGTTAASVLAATDDNTLSDLSTDTKLTTLNISGSDQAAITVGSEATKLATINTTGMSDDLTLTLQAVANQTVTGGDAKETVAFGTTLNNSDTVNLGGGVDAISATVTSSTATTGALSVSNVETLNLTNGGTSVIDATGITGATEIAVLTNTTKTTVTSLGANTAIGIGHNDTNGATAGLFDVALADATGTADTLTFNLNNTLAGNNAVELKATGVETITLKQTDTTDTSLADYTFDVDSLNASKIVIEGAKADVGNSITLTALDTDTTAVDATGFYGVVVAASGTAIATTYDVRGGVGGTSLTGSSKNDTFTFTTAMTADDATVDGNGGTDTLSMVLGTGAQDFDSITDVDTINFSASGTVAITTQADADVLDGINEATKVTFTGGNSISTVTLGNGTTGLSNSNTAVLDFSAWNGTIADAVFDINSLDNGEAGITVQVVGTAGKDAITASYDADTDPTVSLNTQGVETLNIDLANSNAEHQVNMALVTGMTTINLTDATAESVEFNNMAAGITIDVAADNGTRTRVETILADATGSDDSQTFIVAALGADDNVDLEAVDIETINISSDTTNQVDLSLAAISMTAATAKNTVNFTGANDIELAATGTDVTTINASGMTTGGAIVQTGRTSSEASTYTGSSGNDTWIMMHANDALDGAAGTGDTLDINMTQAVGTAIIDLGAADQIASFNGGANTVVQTGFENLDIAGLTINGAVVTGSSAANSITGSGLVDQISGEGGIDVIKGGAGDDVITGGAAADYLRGDAGSDTLTGGAGADQFVFHSSANGADTILDWATDDVVLFGADEDGTDDSNLFDGGTIKLPTTDPSALTIDAAGNGGYVTVATTDYIEGAQASTLTTDHIWVVTTAAGYASVTAALNAVDDDAGGSVADDIEGILVYYSSATSKVEMWDVQEAGTATNNFTDETATQLATFDNVAAGDIAASFAATNFAVELIA
jgi:Ca2+-binding RTX toxin-like protein